MVTGHRSYPEEKGSIVRKELARLVAEAISDGYTHFVSGFATGADLIFAQIVIRFKSQYNITLEAAIPYRGRLYTKDPIFQRAIENCDEITVYSEEYAPGCYMLRNSGMVDKSSRIIAVYDNRGNGGTYNTMVYAKKHGKEVRIVDIS